ncbi:hypothetical protein JXM67_05195 [candidate division WOR-3 bacterium]|nr:hypothetical protein [candidate division WOR-3 bacterium]
MLHSTLLLIIAIVIGVLLVALGIIVAALKRQWIYILYMAVPVFLAVGSIIVGELTGRESYPASIPFMAGVWAALIAVLARNKKRE